jgi:F-type H+-transporting ATPase subunit beta
MESKGIVLSVLGQVAEVEFENNPPNLHDVLLVTHDDKGKSLEKTVQMEVWSSASTSSFYCIVLSPQSRLKRGMTAVNTGESIKIPAGDQVLGRVLDIFGNPQDGKPGFDSSI